MKLVLPALAGVVVLAGVLLVRCFSHGLAPKPLAEHVLPEVGEVQAQIARACQGNGEFRAAWEEAVRTAADHLTARVAGARMAGRTGVVSVEMRLPVLPGLDPDVTRAAWALAVNEEVDRRVEAMPLPGGFG